MDEAIYKERFKPINIKDLFMDKNPSLAGWIPGFIYRLLSRILRIDFVNDAFLWHHGHKKNVDGIFLPNESFKHKNEHFVITFGKPIPYDTLDKRFTPTEWAQLVKDHAYLIADDPQRSFSYLKN